MEDGKVIDFNARALGLMRDRLTALDEANACLVSSTRIHLEAVGQVHSAALALFDAHSLEHFVHIVTHDWVDTLKLDAVSLVLGGERPPALRRQLPLQLEPGDSAPWDMDGEPVRFVSCRGAGRHRGASVFGPAEALIRYQALVRLTLPTPWPAGLLALGSREALGFEGRGGAQLLGFLGAVTTHLLASWLARED